MNRNRMLIGLAIALVVAFLLSAYVYRQFQTMASVRAAVPTQQIVVAATALPLGTMLDASKLRMISWPATDPVAGMCTRIADCSNRALIISVAANEPILESKLAPREAGAGLSATIPAGMRAMSVAVNEVVGVAGFVTPGTKVDVLVTGAVSGSGQNMTQTILENVKVLAAGHQVQQDRDGKPETVSVITLLVSPDDADRLAMASTQGKIQLALRNGADSDTASPAPVLQSSMFGTLAPAPAQAARHSEPKAAPPAPYTVEVLAGDKRETKSFTNP